jgi:A/G-specific adenine glycosylase
MSEALRPPSPSESADGSALHLAPALKRQFSKRLLAWHQTHGRSHLPWQHTREPYRVWLSEIMLQQTQVLTVIDYYQRFLARFPTVEDLAAAQLDEVLGLWSGLGYYSRARNLHRCAVEVVQRFGGFPSSAEQLQSLPGIGPSTAAAIASFCFGERAAIFDGNVQRVLARLLGFTGDLARSAASRQLLGHAQQLLPAAEHMPRYSQAIMDLGATVCLPRQPACTACPMSELCVAQRQGQVMQLPVKSRQLKRSSQRLWLLWAERADGSVWLERRPEQGIWGGLQCLPVFESMAQLTEALPPRLHAQLREQTGFKHVLTHRDLYLHPVQLSLNGRQGRTLLTQGQWWPSQALAALGLPTPVRKLLGV